MKVCEVDELQVQKPRIVDDVAQPDVKVAVHALERADDDAVLRCGNAKDVTADLRHARARGDRSGYSRLLSGLSQASGVHFDKLGQSRNDEVPLIGQPISPTAVRQFGIEMRAHEIHDVGGIGVCEKVKVAAKAGQITR